MCDKGRSSLSETDLKNYTYCSIVNACDVHITCGYVKSALKLNLMKSL